MAILKATRSKRMPKTESILQTKLVADSGTYAQRVQPKMTTGLTLFQNRTRKVNNTLLEHNPHIWDWIVQNSATGTKLIILVASAALVITVMWCLSAIIGKGMN